MESQGPVVDYERARMTPDSLEIRRHGADLAIIIPPPQLWRSMIAYSLLLGMLVGLGTICVTLIIVASADAGPTLALGAVALGFVVGVASTVIRIVRLTKHRHTPAVLRVSPDALRLHAPILGRRGSRSWAASTIADISFRYSGALPAFRTYIRLQVASPDEWVDVVAIPSRGTEPLASIEAHVRQTLGLQLQA